jgi:transient receptor potential cation channel subfamily A protein 1
MWKKFLAVVVIVNISIYAAFLISLMFMIINFPAYYPDPLEHHEGIERLMNIIRLVQEDNRTTLNSNEKFEFCYGNKAFRLIVLLSTVICLIKEMIPMWFKGLKYFKRAANWFELFVYGMTLFFLDPFGFFFDSLDVPRTPCPKIVWEVAALTVFLAWIVLLMNFQRLPHVGVYIVMMMSMIKTMVQVVIVASLFVLGFALAFYMLMNDKDEAIFASSGLSLMRITVMIAGDLAYEDILPASSTPPNHNLSELLHQLQNGSRSINLTGWLPMERTSLDVAVSVNAGGGDNGADTVLHASQLSYIFFIGFALLMPIVVLNVLVGHK